MEYRYTAIVLGKKEVGETDRLYILYTREVGKMLVVAKGVRRGEAKLAAQLENGNVVDLAIIKTRGSGKIKGAVAEQTFPSLRLEYEVYQSLLATLERVHYLTETDHADEEVFDLLLEFLTLGETLVKEEKKEKFFFLNQAFLLKLYSALGYTLRTSKCLASGEKLAAEKKYFFCPSEGGFIEASEAKRYPAGFLLPTESIIALRLVLKNSLGSLLKVAGAEEQTKKLTQVAERFYQWTIRH
jgi:DNA repair protein RecO (recombination protein O)